MNETRHRPNAAVSPRRAPKSRLVLSLHILRVAIVIGLAPIALAAQQMDTVDLSREVPETVIPPEFAGGFFARIGGVVVDERGIWVVDRGHTTVLRFDHDGVLRTAYGREGSGPGEFLLPSVPRVDSIVTVTDVRLGRIVRFTLEGEHIETTRQERRPVTSGGMEVPLGDVLPLSDGYLISSTAGWYSFGGSAPSDPYSHVLLFHPDGSRVDTLASYHIDSGRWDAPGRLGGNFETGLGMSGSWAVMGDSLAVLADGIAGTLTRIRIRDGVPVADTIDMGMRARPVSDRDMANFETRLREDKPDLPRRIEFEMAEGWSIATGILPGENGEFWLRQAVRGEQQEWVVVKPGSTRKWRVVLSGRFRLRAIHDGHLYGVALDELDVASVVRMPDPRR